MIGNVREYERMAEVEDKLWWYKILHEKVLNVLSKHKITNNDLIVDLGCGTGELMQKINSQGYRVKGIDLSDTAIDFCKKKNLDVFPLNILDFRQEIFSEKPAVIISNDSLCFFSDNEIKQVLTNIHLALTTKGLVIINYPALEAFKGIHDLSVGIKKRKNKAELERLFHETGYTIEHSEYWPFFLSPLIFLVRSFQRLKLRIRKNVIISSDIDLPPKLINKLFYYITKTEQVMPYKAFGSSLFIIARKL